MFISCLLHGTSRIPQMALNGRLAESRGYDHWNFTSLIFQNFLQSVLAKEVEFTYGRTCSLWRRLELAMKLLYSVEHMEWLFGGMMLTNQNWIRVAVRLACLLLEEADSKIDFLNLL